MEDLPHIIKFIKRNNKPLNEKLEVLFNFKNPNEECKFSRQKKIASKSVNITISFTKMEKPLYTSLKNYSPFARIGGNCGDVRDNYSLRTC